MSDENKALNSSTSDKVHCVKSETYRVYTPDEARSLGVPVHPEAIAVRIYGHIVSNPSHLTKPTPIKP